jgi:hypothetical protein
MDAYLLNTLEAMELSRQGGLMPAAGQQLVFGDRTLLEQHETLATLPEES